MAALIDESGTHKGSPSLSVAAVVGARWQWRKFLSYWSVVSVVDSNAGFNIDKRWIANFGSVDRSGSTKELRETDLIRIAERPRDRHGKRDGRVAGTLAGRRKEQARPPRQK
jgi:hypothetical protein